jgi:peptidoglycan/LPS O-acetylase OafA/YrhL
VGAVLGQFEATRRPELDGLRGIAILLVVIWHYANFVVINDQSALGRYFSLTTGLCWSGVDLFFVLSGFLIGGILIDNRESRNYWHTFYFRRGCRIFPLYFSVLAIFALLSRLQPDGFEWLLAEPMPVVSYSTFTQNFVMAARSSFGAQFLGPTWSLAVEEQFYLVLPLVVRFVPPKRLPFIISALIVCAPLSRVAAYHWFSAHHILASYVLTVCRADALLIGVLCAWAIRQERIALAVARLSAAVNIALLALACAVAWVGLVYQSFFSRGIVFFGFTLIATFYGAVVFQVNCSDGLLRRLLSTKTIGKIGTIAFGLYLLHIPVVGCIYAIFRHQKPMITGVADVWIVSLALVITGLLARISWSLFEKRFIQLGKRFRYNDRKYTLPADDQLIHARLIEEAALN